MKLLLLFVITIVAGCTLASNAPRISCGITLASWCVSKFAPSKLIQMPNSVDRQIEITLDSRIAYISFPDHCARGKFYDFYLFNEYRTVSEQEKVKITGWKSKDGGCEIILERNNSNDDQYAALARNVSYYLFEIKENGNLKQFTR